MLPNPEPRICGWKHSHRQRSDKYADEKTLKRRQGHEERGGKENVNWIVEKETGEEAVEPPEERGGWAEARRK